MKLKTKLARFRKQLASGEIARRQPQLAQILGWVLNFCLGLVLSTVPLMGACGPFGVAAAAQAGPMLSGMLCALGAVGGSLAAFGFSGGIQSAAAVVLVFTASYVFQELKVYKSVWFMPLMAALFTLLTGMLGAVTAVGGRVPLLSVILRTLLAWGACYFFRDALNVAERETETAEKRHMVSLTVLLACVLMALEGAVIANTVSLGRLLSVLAVMAAAYAGGAFGGCAVGCALGLAMDVAGGGTPFFAMAYGVCGLISGVFAKSGRVMFIASLLLTGAVCVIGASAGGLRPELLYEELTAAVVFMLLPGKALNYAGTMVQPLQMAGGERGLRYYTARRLRRMGEALRDLYDTVDGAVGAPVNDGDISRVFDRASEIVCGKCKNKSECWHSDFMDTLSVFNDVTPCIEERGLLLGEDFPMHFREKCLRPDELVAAVNAELRAREYRRRFRERMAESRSAAYSQYADVAELLSQASEELQNAYGPDHLAGRRLARYLSSIDLDADVSVFRDGTGRLHIVMESTKLKALLREPGYLDKLSGAVGVRLCHPTGADGEGEGRITLLEAEPLSVSVGIASLKKKGESVSGDRGTYFKTEQGTLCVILSDGMGSGESAAKESVAAVRILERFLRSGVDPAVAMKMLNAMMLLKNDDSWGFATVDLMCIDLFTGEAAFYKYGAAPSYVRSGKAVRRVRGESLAAGLSAGAGEAAAPDMVKLRLKPGGMALIASDGVIAETDDGWVRKLLGAYEGEDTKALARDTLQSALKKYGCGDDMTVLAVRLDNRA